VQERKTAKIVQKTEEEMACVCVRNRKKMVQLVQAGHPNAVTITKLAQLKQ
jgi:hypothetical protein